jgi:serine-type D-Ala-D-Ala carboxypeptidase/endopeptidase
MMQMIKFTALSIVSGFMLAGMLLAQENPGTSATLDSMAIEADIEAALANRIDEARNTVGIVVGILTPEGRKYLTRGVKGRDSGAPLSPETIFSIGSITKVFTALLLADMVERGEVALDDPVSKYLPDWVEVPSYDGTQITLVDLATHTAALPGGLNADSIADTEQLYEFLSGYTLERAPGEQFEYSNLGVGLLGHVLSLRAGMSYEELLRTRIFEPLGMNSTTITLSDEQHSRTATGYTEVLAVAPSRVTPDLGVMAGAGAVRSTAEDLLTFAAAQLGLFEHPLQSAMQRTVSVSRPAGPPLPPDATIRLGWMELEGGVLGHNGSTPGYKSALAVRAGAQRAAVALATGQPVDRIPIHAVTPNVPIRMFEALPEEVEIELPENVLERYVGTYRVEEWTLRIVRKGNRLIVQSVGGRPLSLRLGQGMDAPELAATSETEFFSPEHPLFRVSFTQNDAGPVAGLVAHVGARDFPAQRIDPP